MSTSTPLRQSPTKTPKERERFLHWTHGIALAGFIGLIYTIRMSDEPIRRSLYLSMAQWTIDIDKVFIEHPDLRPYFYSGKEIELSDTQYNRALSVAEMVIDTMDSVLEHKGYFNGGAPHKGWYHWIDDNFENSPIIRVCMLKYERWLEGGALLEYWKKWKKEHPDLLAATQKNAK